MIIQLSNICKAYGAEDILTNISIQIRRNDRIAIVGRNGSGKSTLLKIIAKKVPYDSGDIFQPKDMTTGYLPQQSSLHSKRTIVGANNRLSYLSVGKYPQSHKALFSTER